MPKTGSDIIILNIHGLLRGRDLELGVDADTGGQTKYVLEYAKQLGEHSGIGGVYIFTRKIRDKSVSADYSRGEETVSKKVKIIRIRCGGLRYIKKEKLWPCLDEFVGNSLKFIRSGGLSPVLIHSHYADAGYAAMRLSEILGIPFIHTGHSLGIPKKKQLVENGMKAEKINSVYNMERRIEAENSIIEKAAFIVVSTQQEIEGQYSLYKNGSKGVFKVIPPGIDLGKFFPYYYINESKSMEPAEYEKCLQARTSIRREFERFLINPERPLITALCRPATRKNIEGLITAYGMDKGLQSMANLAVFAGLRRDITDKGDAERHILTDMLLLMDKYDLYGKMSIPKRLALEYEVPELYRYTASLGGVFVNPAFVEPFGLTLIESAASGLPIVATANGGPRDIIARCRNGILVDVTKPEAISRAIKKLFTNPGLWQKYSNNGILYSRKFYSWKNHCETLMKILKKERIIVERRVGAAKKYSLKEKLPDFEKYIVTDIDNTLLGDARALKRFIKWYGKNKNRVGLGVATGRSIDSAIKVLNENSVPMPDIFITSVGTEIYFWSGSELIYDKSWENYIDRKWRPAAIKSALDGLGFLSMQIDLKKYKLSYFVRKGNTGNIARLRRVLKKKNLACNIIISEGRLLDVLPAGASKGEAVKHIARVKNIPDANIMVCGDAGNDYSMLKNFKNAVVAANHKKELSGHKELYYSPYGFAGALMDGIRRYKF